VIPNACIYVDQIVLHRSNNWTLYRHQVDNAILFFAKKDNDILLIISIIETLFIYSIKPLIIKIFVFLSLKSFLFISLDDPACHVAILLIPSFVKYGVQV
jgi:hypothetical protein